MENAIPFKQINRNRRKKGREKKDEMKKRKSMIFPNLNSVESSSQLSRVLLCEHLQHFRCVECLRNRRLDRELDAADGVDERHVAAQHLVEARLEVLHLLKGVAPNVLDFFGIKLLGIVF